MYRRHPVRVVYGPPLDVKGLKPDQILALIDQAIRSLFDRLRTGAMNDRVAAEPLRLDLSKATPSDSPARPRERVRAKGERKP
jgi:hypothetical protein